MKVRVGDDFYYPDVMVRCGPNDDQDRYYKTDPVLIIEVLSPNTQRYDRGDKWLAYQTLASLKEYVLVAQDRQKIDIYRRGDSAWRQHSYTPASATTIELNSVSLALALSEIYR